MDETRLRAKAPNFFGEKSWKLTPIFLHNWLLITAWILTFLVLPLLFVWSSLEVIHPRVYEQDVLLSDSGQTPPLSTTFNASRN